MVAGQRHPRPWRFAVWMLAAVVASLFIAGCGGKFSAKVNPTADVKVEVKWERQVKAVCELPAAKRVEAMNEINQALINEAFVLFACPGTDPLSTDATPLMVDGTPAMAVQVKVLYLFPELAKGGIQAKSMAPAQSAAGGTPLVRLGATK